MSVPDKIWRKSRSIAKYGWNDLTRPAFSLSEDRILVFHGVDEVGNTVINGRFHSANKLENLIIRLKRIADPVSVEEITETPQGSRPRFAMTFDDGYRNNLTHLFPILEKHNVPATLFITCIKNQGMDMLWTDFLDLSAYLDRRPFEMGNERFVHKGRKGYFGTTSHEYLKTLAKASDWNFKQEMMRTLPGGEKIRINKKLEIYWQLLTPRDIKQLSTSPLITIGSHGVFHNNLTEISKEDALYEINVSRTYLEDIIQKPVTYFAYPDGAYNAELIDMTAKAGYSKQFIGSSLSPDVTKDRYVYERFSTNPFISNFNQIYCMAKNRYL